ncbi:MAG: nucleotidyl transferase AbiEii/AbiGii toxin family protein [Solirubrobacteraceae bacterium]
MTFAVTKWPTPDDIERYRQELGVPTDAIVRDIARLIAIAHMVDQGQLNEDWVLTGGMALRLRGSPRFTMRDTDTSSRTGEPDRHVVRNALTLSSDELEVTPADPTEWKPGRKLFSAQPIEFSAFFAGLGGQPIEDEFSFTVSWRGLLEPAEHVPLVYPYDQLEVPQTSVPVMNLTEQVAEKLVGWCAHKLMKHYVDIAWVFHRLPHEVDGPRLGTLVQHKLDVGRALFPDAYAQFQDLKSVFMPLYDPDRHQPPQGDVADDKAAQIRFAGSGLGKTQAIAIMRKQVLPAIFQGQ